METLNNIKLILDGIKSDDSDLEKARLTVDNMTKHNKATGFEICAVKSCLRRCQPSSEIIKVSMLIDSLLEKQAQDINWVYNYHTFKESDPPEISAVFGTDLSEYLAWKGIKDPYDAIEHVKEVSERILNVMKVSLGDISEEIIYNVTEFPKMWFVVGGIKNWGDLSTVMSKGLSTLKQFKSLLSAKLRKKRKWL